MSNRKLLILAVIAGLMILLAVVQSRFSSKPRSESGTLTYLIQGLNPADIDSIVLGSGQNKVTLKRQGAIFTVVEKDNYPAQTSKVNQLITDCLDIKTGQLYTENKANFKDLGVSEEDAQVLVKFLKADSSLLTGLVIGKVKEPGQESFVRSLSNNKVYTTIERPYIGSRAMDYINPLLISIDRNDIKSVTVSGPNEIYTIRTGQTPDSVIVDNLPEGRKLNETAAISVFDALVNLSFDDVRKESAINIKLNFDWQFICHLQYSTFYRIKIAKTDNKNFITCEADFTDKTPITQKEVQDSNQAELKKKEARLLAQNNAREFSAKHQGWIYEIPTYNADNITKKLSELLETQTESKKPGSAGEPNLVEK